MAKTIKVAPSILSADFARLKEEIILISRAGADLLHVDVMDGHFVPNITVGPCVVEALKKVATVPLDVHLMIASPEKYLEPFIRAGSDWITFHIEAMSDPEKFIDRAHSLGVKVGVSLKPATPVQAIAPIVNMVDLVLVMSVDPGFGGQSFQPEVLPKIREIHDLGSHAEVSIDGGINLNTARQAVEAGVDILVAGTAIFKSPDPAAMVQKLKNILKDS